MKREDEIARVTLTGPYTSWWHMFGWNVFGVLFMGPEIATWRFFDTLNKVENKLNRNHESNQHN